MTDSEDHLRHVLGGIHDWIRTADSKAGAVLSIAALALGWLVEDTAALTAATSGAVFFIASLTLAMGVALAAMALFPVIALENKPWSPLFFGDIASRHGTSCDPAKAARDYVAELAEDPGKVLSEQVIVNSIIAARKYRFVKWAFSATMLGFLMVFMMKLTANMA